MEDGSSPLARGLRKRRGAGRVGRGIIPARAGFTTGTPARSSRATDHPRSRGVYMRGMGASAPEAGSSPLARGLRDARPVHAVGRGIIPARAGFTTTRASRCAGPPDHPRSRGVYEHRPRIERRPPGSSPLARGLRPGGCRPAGRSRIIPARAGFTRCFQVRRRRVADHPRSRGVYRTRLGALTRGRGSSPLARGLLGPGRCAGWRGWIIPARAGFTGSGGAHHVAVADHPRSRGVYSTATMSASDLVGSSPLARGLLDAVCRGTLWPRIIPARAGFTYTSGIGMDMGGDHPRSRGVYRWAWR